MWCGSRRGEPGRRVSTNFSFRVHFHNRETLRSRPRTQQGTNNTVECTALWRAGRRWQLLHRHSGYAGGQIASLRVLLHRSLLSLTKHALALFLLTRARQVAMRPYNTHPSPCSSGQAGLSACGSVGRW